MIPISTNPRLPISKASADSYEWQFNRRLHEVLTEHALSINGATPQAAAPTQAGRYLGEFVPNVASYVELGVATQKYTLTGWIWNGTTWLQQRLLTGN